MTQITDIEQRAKAYSEARASVAAIVTDLHDGIEAIKRQHMGSLKRAINRMAEKHDQLKALIDGNPALFTKPRTVVFHGVKVGYQKAKGSITFTDPERVIKLIRKHFPEQFDVLVNTTEKPVKDALAQLTVDDLKKIGCSVVDAGDAIVIKPTDSEVDKLVDALLKGATEGEAE